MSNLFEESKIRSVWNSKENNYCFSVVYVMSDVEIALADLGEIATRKITKEKKPIGLKENIEVAKKGGNIAKKCKN